MYTLIQRRKPHVSVYIEIALFCNNQQYDWSQWGLYIIHSMRRSLLLCYWLVDEFARFQFVKTKAFKNAITNMYVCPTSAHRDFRYGDRRYKGNTFYLENHFVWLVKYDLRFDLTLLNINMSKNSTFAWFFLLKSLYSQRLFVFLQR